MRIMFSKINTFKFVEFYYCIEVNCNCPIPLW